MVRSNFFCLIILVSCCLPFNYGGCDYSWPEFGSSKTTSPPPEVASGWKISTISDQLKADSRAGSPNIAIDSLDNFHIVYVNNAGLQYLTNESGTWVVSTIDGTGDGGCAIVLDSSDYVHIIYSSNDPKHATNKSGAWTVNTLDSPIGSFSVAIDSTDKIHISTAKGGCCYYYTNSSGTWIETSLLCGAPKTSIAVDSIDNPHICITDGGSFIRYLTNASGSWIYTLVDDSGVYVHNKSSIAIDVSDRIYISYNADPNPDWGLALAYYDLSNWSLSRIGKEDWLGGDTSIAIDKANRLHISYESSTYLKYATDVSGSWSTYFIDIDGNVGDSNQIVADSFGNPHILYYDLTNNALKLASKK